MPQTIVIELRVDFDTTNKKVKEPIMLDIAKTLAAQLLTQAMMIKDTREPQITLQCGDLWSTTEDIKLVEQDSF
jgi:hypothetical protein